MNRAAFYFSLRKQGLAGTLNQSQVSGMETILDAIDGAEMTAQAYMLATVWHECDRTMQPIMEHGQISYFDKYEPGNKIGKMLGNTERGDGYRFRGAGYVQLTGRRNFAKAGAALGLDLLAHPELALVPANAAKIMLHGMAEGWFTGKKLSDYLPGDYFHARRIINGMDRAATIATYAEDFERALRKAA